MPIPSTKKILGYLISTIFILFVIIVRFYGLGSMPRGLTQDEAYYLYDGYSIHETGNDIHGQHLPLIFKSTSEYKLNLPYLISTAIDIVGLDTVAARLPSAIFGLLSLIVVAFIIFEYTHKVTISIVSVLALALSPWNFGISRLFFEANVGVFFLMLGFYFALKILQDTKVLSKWLLLGSLSAIAGYFYGPYRYLGFSLVIFTIILSEFQRVSIKLKYIAITLLTFFLILSPLLLQFGTAKSLTRLTQETKLHQHGYELTIDEARMNCYLQMGKNAKLAKICYVFWNKPMMFLEKSIVTGIKSLSPEYLFFTSVDEYIAPTGYGAFPSYLLPFYLLGIFVVAKKIFINKEFFLLALSLFSALAVTSVVGEVVYHRNVYGLLLIFIIIALGFYKFIQILSRFNNKHIYTVTLAGLLLLAISQHSKYLIKYYTSHIVSNPLLFKYDAPEVFHYLEDYQDYTIYDNVFFAPIYAGIYWHLSPADFQQNAIWADPDDWGFSNAKHWNNLFVTETTLNNLLCRKNQNPDVAIKSLVIDDPGKYNPAAALLTHDFSGSLTLHAVYDIDQLYPFVLENYPADLCKVE